jgi:hypothetical protein
VSLKSVNAAGPAPVQSPLYLYATLLSKGASVTHKLKHSDTSSWAEEGVYPCRPNEWLQYRQGQGQPSPLNGGLELAEGDGAFAIGEEGQPIEIKNVGESTAEVLLFDLD